MDYIKILRPKQWVKNLLIFIPLIFAGCWEIIPIIKTCMGFVCFSLAASCIYIINDLKDLEKDRSNPFKNQRPLAKGTVSEKQAVTECIICFVVALAISYFLPLWADIAILIYGILNIFYIYILKNIIIIDVLCLSISFILRIIAGGFLADVEVTQWILVTCFFLALFLGFAKRRGEVLQENIKKRKVAQEYTADILDRFIMTCGMLAVICYALFTLDADVIAKFGAPHLFYTVIFPVYGIFRYITIIPKRADTDPTNILYSDRNIIICIILWLIITLSVMHFHL